MQYDLNFAFSDNLIENKTISAKFDGLPLNDALEILLKGTGLRYEVLDNRFVLLAKDENFVSGKARRKFRLCGQIMDALSRDPLFAANVYLKGNNKGVTSDLNGEWIWEDMFSLQDSLVISYLGYEEVRLPLSFFVGGCKEIHMAFASIEISPIIITEYIASGISKDPYEDFVRINPNKMSIIPGMIEADVMHSIQQLPGVNSTDESASEISIRGGNPDQNLILWDGIPVYNTGHFFGMISAFNPDMIKEVKVFRSNFGSQYGGRVAGVVDMQSKSEIPEHFSGGIGINLTHANFHAQIPLVEDKASVLFSARSSIYDLYESPTYTSLSEKIFSGTRFSDPNEDPINDLSSQSQINDLRFSDVSAQFQYYLSTKDYVRISGFANYNLNDNEISDFFENLDTRDRLENEHSGLNLHYGRKWNDRHSSQINLTHSDYFFNYHFDFNNQLKGSSIFVDNRQNNILDQKIGIEHLYNNRNFFDLRAGYEYNAIDLDYLITSDLAIIRCLRICLLNRDSHSDTGHIHFYHSRPR
jgi:hypothetical protein